MRLISTVVRVHGWQYRCDCTFFLVVGLAVGRDHVWSVLATYMYMHMDSTTACFGCVGFKRFDSGLLTYIANSTTRSSWM